MNEHFSFLFSERLYPVCSPRQQSQLTRETTAKWSYFPPASVSLSILPFIRFLPNHLSSELFLLSHSSLHIESQNHFCLLKGHTLDASLGRKQAIKAYLILALLLKLMPWCTDVTLIPNIVTPIIY